MIKKLTMKNTIKILLATASVALLAACGGGGGGGTPGPVASLLTFDLRAAYVSSFINTSTNRFTITGTQDGISITGSGTGTYGALSSGTFEGGAAQQRTSTVTGSFIVEGQSFPLNYSSVSWVDSNYYPLGADVGDEYTVVVGTATIPTAVRVGDSGQLYMSNRFTSSAKTTPLGTITSTYVVEPDTASTALVKFISTYKSTSNTIEKIVSAQYRVNTSNGFTRINETSFNLTNGLSLTINY